MKLSESPHTHRVPDKLPNLAAVMAGFWKTPAVFGDPSTQPTDESRTSVPPGCWQQESPGGLTSHSGAVFEGRSAPALEFHFGVDNPDEVTD